MTRLMAGLISRFMSALTASGVHLAVQVLRLTWPWLCSLLMLSLSNATAGQLTAAEVQSRLPAEFKLGERNAGLPLWPIYAASEPGTKPELAGYVFESVDFEPARGFSGKPINLLVAMTPQGGFLDVQLVEHKEPLFRSEKGTGLLADFAAQYRGLSTRHNIQIFDYRAKTRHDDTHAWLHGVQGGTVTVKAMDRSVVQAALTVARAHERASRTGQDIGTGGMAALAGQNEAAPRALSWAQLQSRGLVETTRLRRGQIETAFVGTRAQGHDPLAAQQPDEIALTFHVALLSDPLIGRNLLDDAGWRLLSSNRREGQALLVTESGPLYKMAYERQRVQVDVPYILKQGGRELGLRAMAFDQSLAVPGYPETVKAYVLLVDEATPLDPTQPYEVQFKIGRRFGVFPQNVASAVFDLNYQHHGWRARFAHWRGAAWMGIWEDRWIEITVLVVALALLSVGLLRQTWLSASPQRLRWFRNTYFVFTLGFIGWTAQGQLSVVNLTAAIEAIWEGDGLGFFLTDPMTVLLWLYVAVTLLVWGRGTFCGWLCPFGALQDLLSQIARALGWHPVRLRIARDRQLKVVKYVVLGVVLSSPWLAHTQLAPLGELALEAEPFKTAISLYFVRDWPYVLWAVACLVLSVVVYRGYCRYICPLGAALASLQVLQRWGWIERREACGTPCQTCRHTCEFQAIEPSGAVDYSECFQCLDCVQVYQDDQRCLPLILERKGRVIPIKAASPRS